MDKEGLIKNMGSWSGDDWVWDCRWRRSCTGRATSEEDYFRDLINGVKVRKDKADFWGWVHKSDGAYSVKDAYAFLTPMDCILDKRWLKVIWCKYVPSKMSIFGWRLFLNKLPTKENLYLRGVLVEGAVGCEFCNEGVEQLQHVFCECKEVWLVWMKVLGWWGCRVFCQKISLV
ncbi:hypothetical protein SLA2020_293910 [Shorea laevis]